MSRTPILATAEFMDSTGTTGKPVTITRGSFVMEVGMWLLFLFPGMIYSVWRLTTRYKGCRFCDSGELVPLHSPRGKMLNEEMRQ